MSNFETVKDSERGKTTEELISESQRGITKGSKESQDRRNFLLQKITGTTQGAKGKLSARNKIEQLNKMLLPHYILKLEEAAQLLASYESELDELDKTLQKMSPNLRAAMGGSAVDQFRKNVRISFKKLQIHQEATIDRLTS